MRKMDRSLRNGEDICCVCLEEVDQFYNLANCKHQFCKNCCLEYIEAKVGNYSQAKCLQQGCNKALNSAMPIYQYVNPQTKSKINKYTQFRYLQDNLTLKACKNPQCEGVFSIEQKGTMSCKNCKTMHCKKCFEIQHGDQSCKTAELQKEMNQLNFKKCPKCSIWVQKAAGCNYIQCKCGTSFCYKCGADFYKDPCRKKQIWKSEFQVRQYLKRIVITSPSTFKVYFLFILRISFLICTIIPLTIFMSLICPIIAAATFFLFFVLLAPLIVTQGIMGIQNSRNRCIALIAFIIFYPLIGALFGIMYIFVLILYPFCKNSYHHGIYDPFDAAIMKGMSIYLSIVVYLIQLNCCS